MKAELRSALEEGRAAEALALIEALPDAERTQVETAGWEADLLGRLGRHDEELALLSRLIDEDPSNASLKLSAANAFKTVGRRDEAITSVREALALRPGYGKAWWLLSDLKSYEFGDEDVEAMQVALSGATSPGDAMHLHFALGRAFEQRADAERSFGHYSEANALAARANPRRPVSARVDRAVSFFTPEFFADRSGFGHASDEPIFIVGLHRSGSTLVEQFLGSHPEIEATSELPILGQLVRQLALDPDLAGHKPIEKLASLDKERAVALGAEYLERARAYRSTGKRRFTDKMPDNWLHIGLIQVILPNAVIVDARRHPMAGGFSNFRQHFGRGASWTSSLESIGTYYRDYLRLMRHFDRVLPGKVHHAINERLVDDFEAEVRRLLVHVGVPFDPACLDFHYSGRPVRSASAEQVRRPVNREGLDQWRAFAPWLGPLERALGPALEDWQE